MFRAFGVRGVSSLARLTPPTRCRIWENPFSELETSSPSTYTFDTTSAVLENLFKLIKIRIESGDDHKKGKKPRHPHMHPDSALQKAHLDMQHEKTYKKMIMLAGAYLTKVEDCESVSDKAVELTAKKLGEKNENKWKESAAANPELLEAHTSMLLHELAKKGHGSVEAPLGPMSVPLLAPHESLDVYGENIDFIKNDKLFCMLEGQSILHSITLHTVINGEIDVFRFTTREADHGLHHFALPILNFEGLSEINIRDVLQFYTSYIGADALFKALHNIYMNEGREDGDFTKSEVKSILKACPIYKKTLTAGDTFMASTGLWETGVATPDNALAYFDKHEYEKLNILKEGFPYIDEKTGKKTIISCTFDAPRREIRALPTPRYPKDFTLPPGGIVGLTHSTNPLLCIEEAYRKEPPIEIPARYRLK